jgi:hypothetical protein
LHANAVSLAGTDVLNVRGGAGGSGVDAGGGGGGGRILILANSYTNIGSFDIAGGAGGGGTPDESGASGHGGTVTEARLSTALARAQAVTNITPKVLKPSAESPRAASAAVSADLVDQALGELVDDTTSGIPFAELLQVHPEKVRTSS